VTLSFDPETASGASRGAVDDPDRLRALQLTALLDTPVERAFDRLTKLAATLVGVPIVLVSLVTEDRQFFKSQCGLGGAVAGARETPLSHSFCQYVVEDRAPLVITDARRDARLADNLAIVDLNVIAYAGFPLISADGHVLGSFCAIDTQPRTWTREELATLDALADAVMDLIALRTQAVAATTIGERLQRALVPDRADLDLPDVATLYRPGEELLLVGGDFHLCTQLPDGSVNLTIGDVSGHGPEAAAFATSLRSAWRALMLTEAPLHEHLARLNVVALAQKPQSGLFATALTVTIAPDRRSVTACSAGHPPAMIIEDGCARELHVSPGLPLAVRADGAWPAKTTALAPGAGILLYTDGLIEGRAHRGADERLGAAALLEEVERLERAGGSASALLADLADFALRANGAPLEDDVAAVLVRL
jgi:sigma-B regulation protein RsbU (phosphoserine phosphatase)